MTGSKPTQALTIGASNCVAVIGMSWAWARRFARAEGVPIYQVSPRRQLVPAAQLLAAFERHRRTSSVGAIDADDVAEPTFEQACAKLVRILSR